MQQRALIVGVSGVTGSALAERLLAQGWQVYGLSRGRTAVITGVTSLAADLTDEDAVKTVLQDITVDKVFFSAWARQKNEKENIRVNGAMVRNVLDALGAGLKGGHVALITGLKHYLGPFDAYGKVAVRSPRSAKNRAASRSKTSTMPRRMKCSLRPISTVSAGASTVRIR